MPSLSTMDFDSNSRTARQQMGTTHVRGYLLAGTRRPLPQPVLDGLARLPYNARMTWRELRRNLEHRHWPDIARRVPVERHWQPGDRRTAKSRAKPYASRYSGLAFFESVLNRVYHNTPFAVELRDPPGRRRYYPPVSSWYYRLAHVHAAGGGRSQPSALLAMWQAYLRLVTASEVRAWRDAFMRCRRRETPPGAAGGRPSMIMTTPWFIAMDVALDAERRRRGTGN